MRYLFISDLHLDPSRPEITAVFMRFLKREAAQTQVLYILGDLFEYWVGDDDNNALHAQIAQAIRQFTEKGPKVYFMHGNRDFLIGKRFLNAANMQWLTDPAVIQLGKTTVLLMHGDLLCTQDKPYLRSRKRLRSTWLQKLFLICPLSWRLNIANKLRQKSQRYQSTLPDHIMDVSQTTVEQYMKQYGTNLLIHGHTHRPAIHSLKLDNAQAHRVVLAAWHHEGNALICNVDGQSHLTYQLEYFKQ